MKPGLELLASCLGGDQWKEERPRLRKAANALVDDHHEFNAKVRDAIDSSGIEWKTARSWRGVVDRLSYPMLTILVGGESVPDVVVAFIRSKAALANGNEHIAKKLIADARAQFPHLINKPAAVAAPTKGADILASYDVVLLTKIIDTIVGELIRLSRRSVAAGDCLNMIEVEEAENYAAGYFSSRMGMTDEQAVAMKSVLDLRRDAGSAPDQATLAGTMISDELIGAMNDDMIVAADKTVSGLVDNLIQYFDKDVIGTSFHPFDVTGLRTTPAVLPVPPVGKTADTIVTDDVVTPTTTETENNTMTNATTSNIANVTIDPNLKQAIDMMLSNATGGKLTTDGIAAMANEAQTNKAKADGLEATVKRLQQELMHSQAAAASAGTPTVAGDGGFPNSEVTFVKANTIDWSGNGAKPHPALDFNVPMWKHDGVHPLVPTIDPHFVFSFKPLLKVLTALANGTNIWAHGLPGTGKTEFFMQIAARLNWPVVQVNLDENIERSDYVGSTQLHNEGGVTVSKLTEGALLQAMRIGALFVNDEMDYGRSGVMYVLQRVLQSGKFLLTEDGGRLVSAHPMFRICATANTRGQGDELGCFPGARVQSNALLDRFGAWVEFNYLEASQEEHMLTAKIAGLDPKFAKQAVAFANEVREAFKKGNLLKCITPRGLIAMGAYYAHFSTLVKTPKDALTLALDMAFLDSVPSDNKQTVTELAARTFSL